MEILEYNLADSQVIKMQPPMFTVMVWQPGFVSVVLGQSNKAETSLWEGNIIADNVSVYKRPSGGETVVLSPRTLVVSVLIPETKFRAPGIYFQEINRKIIRALQDIGLNHLRADGISDICIGDKKILGSSLYRGKDRVFYHAVLNVSENTRTLERYLKHPPREPQYRNGRSHEEFVTSLAAEGYFIDCHLLQQTLHSTLSTPTIQNS